MQLGVHVWRRQCRSTSCSCKLSVSLKPSPENSTKERVIPQELHSLCTLRQAPAAAGCVLQIPFSWKPLRCGWRCVCSRDLGSVLPRKVHCLPQEPPWINRVCPQNCLVTLKIPISKHSGREGRREKEQNRESGEPATLPSCQAKGTGLDVGDTGEQDTIPGPAKHRIEGPWLCVMILSRL